MRLLCKGLLIGLLALNTFAAETPSEFKVGGFTFTKPASWVAGQASGMRKAQFKVTDEKVPEPAEIIFFEFAPGQGGSTLQNVNRWLGMFEEPREKINAKVESETKTSAKVTYVSAEGTYLSGMPGGEKTSLKNHALRGAIIEGANGNIFIRMIAPVAMLKTAESEFKKMVQDALK